MSVATVVFNPAAGSGGGSVDGSVENDTASNPGDAWSALRLGTGSGSNDTSNTAINLTQIIAHSTTNLWQWLERGLISFDLRSYVGWQAISATLSLWGASKQDSLGISPNINVYQGTLATRTQDNISFGLNDLINQNPFLGSSLALSSPISFAGWSTAGYNDFVLNSAGIALVNLGGKSVFCLANANYDAANVAPAWSAGALGSYIQAVSADAVVTPHPPKLTVVMTEKSADASYSLFPKSAVRR